MNSMSLFNFKYFIQNIKKSKAVIIFISLLLPIFTFLILSLFNQDGGAVDFWQVGLFNILLMYIVPVVLSISFFNFVFKKKSCDFVMGMPLSRKTIFVTNTIGGILLILLIQIVTALIAALFSLFSVGAIIFAQVILDVFLFFTISYIFVFVACNLAISFSGNIFATIVSLLLILFLVPFTLLYSRISYFRDAPSYELKVDAVKNQVTCYDTFNFTAPSMAFESFFVGTSFDYNAKSMAKMAILSIIYFGVGFVLFNKKKFEMAEESYENNNIHIVVKLLTLAPFVAFFCMTQGYESSLGWLFFTVVIGAYYYVFDLITNKKIELKVTIPLFIVSSLSMMALYLFLIPKLDVLYKKEFKIDDVKSIEVASLRAYSYVDSAFGLVIEDEEIIQDILKDCNEYYNYSPYTSSYTDYKCTLKLKLQNGKIYTVQKWVGRSLDKAVKKYGDTLYKYIETDAVPKLSDVNLTQNDRTQIKEKLKEDLNSITYKEYYEIITQGVEFYNLILAQYKDHKLESFDYSYDSLKNTSKYAVGLLNKQAVASSHGVYSWTVARKEDLQELLVKLNPDAKFADLEELEYEKRMEEREAKKYSGEISGDFTFKDDFSDFKEEVYDYDRTTYGVIDCAVNQISSEEMFKFIKSNKDEEFDVDKPYVIISGYGLESVLFYTNDVEGFYKLIAKTYNETIYPDELTFKLNENI